MTPAAPRDPWLPRTAVIAAITAEREDVTTYHLEYRDPPEAAAAPARPGQFHMLYLPGVGEMPISISDVPVRGACGAHTIRHVGRVTRAMAGMSVGQTLGVRGPFGTPWPIEACRGRDVVLVAGGIGMAPLRSALKALLDDRPAFGHITLLYGARQPDQILFAREFAAWVERGVAIKTTVDRWAPGWAYNVGVVTTLLDRLRSFDPQKAVLLCCGPEVMMKFVMTSAQARGIDATRLWLSAERAMQCAVGLCGRCQLGPLLVCRDGPVLDYVHFAPWLAIDQL